MSGPILWVGSVELQAVGEFSCFCRLQQETSRVQIYNTVTGGRRVCQHRQTSALASRCTLRPTGLMSEALDRPQARRIALVGEKADGSDVARLEVPPATLRLLSQILALMARQQTFVLYPESSELTTKQAAEVLGVSRPFLIRVLEAGEIPYRKVGRHRRVLMKDILAYKQSMQVKRRAALDELVKASEEVGGYDL
jgi:excisionase family DNA binding protein